MKISNRKKSVVLLALFLIIFCTIYILLNGQTYTLVKPINAQINNIDEISIKVEEYENIDESLIDSNNEISINGLSTYREEKNNKDVIRISKKEYKDGNLILKIESIAKGEAYINIGINGNYYYIFVPVYVHNFGIITIDSFFGDFNGSIIFSIAISIFLVYVIALMYVSYKRNVKNNMYQYKNISYFGIILFLTFTLISQVLSISNSYGLIDIVNRLVNISGKFSFIMLPIAFIASLLVTISNIKLVRKLSFSKRIIVISLSFKSTICNCNFINIFISELLCSLFSPTIFVSWIKAIVWLLGNIYSIFLTLHRKGS